MAWTESSVDAIRDIVDSEAADNTDVIRRNINHNADRSSTDVGFAVGARVSDLGLGTVGRVDDGQVQRLQSFISAIVAGGSRSIGGWVVGSGTRAWVGRTVNDDRSSATNAAVLKRLLEGFVTPGPGPEASRGGGTGGCCSRSREGPQ